MPCDQIILNRVELPKMNEALLKKALVALKANGIWQTGGVTYFTLDGVSCQISNGKLVVPEGSEHLADKLKRAYSSEVVQYTAKRNGWTLTKKGEYAYEVVK